MSVLAAQIGAGITQAIGNNLDDIGTALVGKSPFAPFIAAAQKIFQFIGNIVSAELNNRYWEYTTYQTPVPDFSYGENIKIRKYIKARFDVLPKGYFSQIQRESFYKPVEQKPKNPQKMQINYIYVGIGILLLIVLISIIRKWL